MRRSVRESQIHSPRFLFAYLALAVATTCARPQHASFVDDKIQRKLMQFGYLSQSNLETGELRHDSELTTSVREFQKFVGLPVTGKVDRETEVWLDKPRCGLPDKSDRGYRSKRYTVQGQKWDHNNLTWTLDKESAGKLQGHTANVRREFNWAFGVWQKNSKLTFKEVRGTKADIVIGFYKKKHDDNYAFDGTGSVLAHAFFPGTGLGGDVHFDDDEKWNFFGASLHQDGTSLFFVAAHEFGHALGLSHSSVKDSLMFPYYQGSKDIMPEQFELHSDDKIGIQQIYGVLSDRWGTMPDYFATTKKPTQTTKKPNSPTKPTTHSPHRPPVRPERPERPVRPERPDTCDTSYDAITFFRNKEIWVFKGEYFWRIGESGVMGGYPAKIAPSLVNLCQHSVINHVDAVYERSDGAMVFFQDKRYFVCEGSKSREGPLTDLGLPSSLQKLDAAFVWGHNGKTYLFANTSYWRIDEDTKKVELDYPRDMSMWSGIGTHIDAAFKWKDGKIYFFKGKAYWKFNDMKMRVEHEKPMLSAPFWMGCPKRLEEPLIAPTDTITSGGAKNAIWTFSALLLLVASMGARLFS